MKFVGTQELTFQSQSAIRLSLKNLHTGLNSSQWVQGILNSRYEFVIDGLNGIIVSAGRFKVKDLVFL